MDDAAAFEGWLRSAQGWAEASLALVSASTVLSTGSLDLADHLEGAEHDGLPAQLRDLAAAIERDSQRAPRPRTWPSAADLEQYRDVLG